MNQRAVGPRETCFAMVVTGVKIGPFWAVFRVLGVWAAFGQIWSNHGHLGLYQTGMKVFRAGR